MKFYQKLYTNLCERGKHLKQSYLPGSGLHAHHITPRHMGGKDDADNLTYLHVREHRIAHFLLWKMHYKVNDLRAMYMLGANLTPANRRAIGQFCHDNQLGVHSPSFLPQKVAIGRRTGRLAVANQLGIHNPATRAQFASIGGKASWAANNNAEFKYWASPEGRKMRATMGSKSQPKKPASDGIRTKKFFTDEERDEFISCNPGWRRGVHWSSPNKGMPGKASSNRRSVEIDGATYPCIALAANAMGVSSATVINRCRSDKWPSWAYTN